MRKTRQTSGERIVKDIKRKTRKQYSAEEKIRIVLDGLRGRESVGELCRIEGISQGLYYKWSKDFLEAGKKRRGTISCQRCSSASAQMSLRCRATMRLSVSRERYINALVNMADGLGHAPYIIPYITA